MEMEGEKKMTRTPKTATVLLFDSPLGARHLRGVLSRWSSIIRLLKEKAKSADETDQNRFDHLIDRVEGTRNLVEAVNRKLRRSPATQSKDLKEGFLRFVEQSAEEIQGMSRRCLAH